MKKNIKLALLISIFIGVIISCASINKTASVKEIPFSLEDGKIVIEATINGKTGRYAWDTTSNISTIKDIDKNWIFSGRSEVFISNVFVGTVNRYLVGEMIIGGIPVTATSLALEATEHDLNYFSHHDLDGRLSVDVFSGYWCEVSFSKNKINLYPEKPSGFTQIIYGASNDNSTITIPINIDGTSYGFYINAESDPFVIPISVLAQKPSSDYRKFLSADDECYWVQTTGIEMFDDSFTSKIVRSDRYVSDVIGLGEAGERIGVLGWKFLQNYDLLFDFTGLEIKDAHKAIEIYYSLHSRSENRGNFFITEYPGGEIGAFASVNPQGVTLYLAEDSPLLSLGINVNTAITRINGVSVDEIARAGIREYLDFDYQTELTVLDENNQERVVELAQLRN